MDDGRIGDEMTLTAIAKRLDDISARLGSVQSDTTSLNGQFATLSGQVQSLSGQFTSLDGQVKSLDGKLTALDHKMTIEFEATRGLIDLGFENVQILDEKMDRRFDEAEHAHAGHRSVLEAAIASLSRDMKKPRRPGRRR